MTILDSPTFYYPIGGEEISDKEIEILWREPQAYITSTDMIWYELFVTEDFDDSKKNKWIRIAIILKNNSSFLWKRNTKIKGDKCRFKIRTVNHKGERSSFSFTPNNFSIKDKKLPLPSVYKPMETERYFSYLPIILDKNGIDERCSKRAFYQVFYKSDNLNKDWTILLDNIYIEQDPVYLDISNWETSDDYSFKFQLVDDNNFSEPVFVNNININSINYFKIDTKPPIGNIKILNNNEYINTKEIVFNLSSFDETSGVESYKIMQTNLDKDISDENYNVLSGTYKIANIGTWNILNGDGSKLIQSIFKDYAGNEIQENSDKLYFRMYHDVSNMNIDNMILIENGENKDIWSSFYNDSFSILYKNRSFIVNLSGKCTSLASYSNVLYIAIQNNENKGILQRYISSNIETIYTFIDSDSIIKSMIEYDNKIFLGLENGDLYSYNGVSLTKEYSFTDNVIYRLDTDGNLLFIFLDNSNNFYIVHKTDVYNYVSFQLE